METILTPPSSLLFEGNIAANWKKWKQKFFLYLEATGLDTKPESRQVALLLHIIGEKAIEKFNTFSLSKTDSRKPQSVMQAFEQYCIPKANESVDRHIFFSRIQQPGETFDLFLTDLKKLSKQCGFDTLKDSLIKDRIISGLSDSNLKNRLLREEDLDLEKCVRICKASELAQHQLKTLTPDTQIQAITKKAPTLPPGKDNQTPRRTPNKGINKSHGMENRRQPQPTYQHKQNEHRHNTKGCSRCGFFHDRYKCPAHNKTCNQCKRIGHFAKMCRSKRLEYIAQNLPSQVNSEATFIGSIDKISRNDWIETLIIDNAIKLTAKLDTGAQCNVLPLEIYNRKHIPHKYMVESFALLTKYGSDTIKVIGKCKLPCKTIRGTEVEIKFQVVDEKGLPTIIDLGLIIRVEQIGHEMKTYKEIPSGEGLIKNYEYNIKLKSNASGHIAPCRRIPIQLVKPLKIELDKMVQMGVIKKVDEPSDWVNALVIVRKLDGSLRICLDPHYLNKVILREHYYIPTFEDLCSRMSGSTVFSMLDADKTFWQVKLSDNSSKYTTFNTPFGRYKFLRMPYGISSAPEVFYKCFQEMFSDINGVEVYLDDIIVYGKDKGQHDERLKLVIQRAVNRGVKFNYKKCKIAQEQVKYMGHIFSKHGIRPDPNKIIAIKNMKPPTNSKELETVLGMITYLGRYIPNLSQQSAILRDLIKKNRI